ncbi:MAG TPA: formylglycine-generating enzyme family protein [Microvirga sp.]
MTAAMLPTLVGIPAGTIVLKDDRTRRQWRADLAPFAISKYPVTQAEYAAVMHLHPSTHAGPQRPVEGVSWLDAIRFCNALSVMSGCEPYYVLDDLLPGADPIPGSTGYRLPSEAEWEYACRAGTQGPRYGELDAIAWYRDNAGGHPHDVGHKEPNAWGLYDTLGNVWEWCADQYDPEVYGAYRVFRGGGWADAERGCLATNRRRSHPTFAIDDLGFRVARSC